MTKAYKKKEPKIGEAGFSIMEITVIVLLIGIILAFVVPKINEAIRAYKLRNTADHVAERLAAVRALALAKNQNVTFSFNNTSEQYGFDFTGASGDGIPDTSDPDNPSLSYFLEALPDDITTTFPGNVPIKVTFNSRGEMPIGATEQYIAIRNGSRLLQVHVNLRGRITVE
jgi:Tfp pilus assembly protein FimT